MISLMARGDDGFVQQNYSTYIVTGYLPLLPGLQVPFLINVSDYLINNFILLCFSVLYFRRLVNRIFLT